MSYTPEERKRIFEAMKLLLSDYRGPIRCPLKEDADLQITASPRRASKKVEYELRCPECGFTEHALTSAGNGPYEWIDQDSSETL